MAQNPYRCSYIQYDNINIVQICRCDIEYVLYNADIRKDWTNIQVGETTILKSWVLRPTPPSFSDSLSPLVESDKVS